MSKPLIGLIMGFGAGVLISCRRLRPGRGSAEMTSGSGWAIAGLFVGSLVFFGGDLLIDKLGGSQRKDTSGKQADGSLLAIVLGTMLDGIPESPSSQAWPPWQDSHSSRALPATPSPLFCA
ncbi:MAG TPA: hypothetical protein VEX88_11360 [Glaciibacter sp.]|nr:hypothetical protein [Glaciibacter sp.]